MATNPQEADASVPMDQMLSPQQIATINYGRTKQGLRPYNPKGPLSQLAPGGAPGSNEFNPPDYLGGEGEEAEATEETEEEAEKAAALAAAAAKKEAKLYANKYKSVEALEAAYQSQQKEVQRLKDAAKAGKGADDSKGKDKEGKENKEDKNKSIEDSFDPSEVFSEASLVDAIAAFKKEGSLPEEWLGKATKTPPTEEMVQNYFKIAQENAKLKETARDDAVLAAAGGDDMLKTILDWSGKTLSKEEIALYNKGLAALDPAEARATMKALRTRYDKRRSMAGPIKPLSRDAKKEGGEDEELTGFDSREDFLKSIPLDAITSMNGKAKKELEKLVKRLQISKHLNTPQE